VLIKLAVLFKHILPAEGDLPFMPLAEK
jgi:hypothetical protein